MPSGLSGRLVFINLPPRIAALLVGARLLPTAGRATERVRFNIPGAMTPGVGLVAILYAVTQAGGQSWTSPSLWGTFVVGAASLALFVSSNTAALDRFLIPPFSGDPSSPWSCSRCRSR